MASGSKKYGYNDNKLTYSQWDDDGIAAEFLNTSTATYLASDRLPPGPEQQAADEAEIRRQEVLRQMRQIETRTLQSTKNSKMLLNESEKVGLETAEELVKQREQLQNTERKLDNIMGDLKDSQKNINSIKSVFNSLKTWWNTPKHEAQKNAESKESSGGAKSPDAATPNRDHMLNNPHLSSAYERSQTSLATCNSTSTHPAFQLRGLDDDDDDDHFSQDWRETSKRVNDQLDADLDEMSHGLSRLKGLAQGLGAELTDQNTIIDRISEKADHADVTIGSQNTQMKKLLKR